MSVFSKAEGGTSFHGSRFPRIVDRTIIDCDYGTGYPVFGRFVLPGDIWRTRVNIFTRMQPTLAPSLTRNYGRYREFFVPLRLVEASTYEKVITGAKDGFFDSSFSTVHLEDIYERYDRVSGVVHTSYVVEKGSLLDVMFGMPAGTYSAANVRSKKSAPAAYWVDAYYRIYWDFYRDENLDNQAYAGDFDAFLAAYWMNGIIFKAPTSVTAYSMFTVAVRKDYFTSALPWQLKGIAPTISANISSAVFNGTFAEESGTATWNASYNNSGGNVPFYVTPASSAGPLNDRIRAQLNNNVVASNLSFNAADFRTLMAQTRIFERMARCGSRYTEFLRSNFGVAPADETLQRPRYLGGMKFDVLVTEIEQTAADGSNPVGTLRGHGVSNSGDQIHRFRANEFGMLIGILDYSVDTQYTQGVSREYTYKYRADMYNPSYQHLSEQEVRGAEVFYGNDVNNDTVFGYQAYANELRSGKQKIVGDMRGTLSYWQQGVEFPSRPSLNSSFVSAFSKRSSYRKPYVVQTLSNETNPLIVDCFFVSDVYRPMARYGTPGLVDHL